MATRLTLATVATRSPAAITGTASGSSTLRRRWNRVRPIAVAAAATSSGTAARPSATTRTSSATVETVSAITTLTGSRIRVPSSVGITTNRASDGIVYSSPVTDTTGGYTHR